jgi:hypothetical protein
MLSATGGPIASTVDRTALVGFLSHAVTSPPG